MQAMSPDDADEVEVVLPACIKELLNHLHLFRE